MKTSSILTSSMLLFAICAHSQTVLYDFNEATDLDGFNVVAENAGGRLESVTFGGIDDTRAVRFNSDSGAETGGVIATVNAGSVNFDLSVDQSITQSIVFTPSASFANNRRALFLGLTSAASVTFNNSTGATPTVPAIGAGITVIQNNSGVGIDAAFGQLGDGNKGLITPSVSEFSLTNGSKYFLSITYNYSAADNDWEQTLSLNNIATDGTIGSSIASSTLGTTYDDDWSGTTGLSGYISTHGMRWTGVNSLDNATLVAVPEPSSYALIFGALSLGWIVNRRRA